MFIIIILVLGALEFFIAASFILSFESDPAAAIFLGYSAARWAIAITSIVFGIASLYLANRTHKKGLPHRMEVFLTRNFSTLQSVSVILLLISFVVLLSPANNLGEYAEYFIRLRPLLFVLTALPFQFFAPTVFKTNYKLRGNSVKYFLVTLLFLAIIVGFILLTKLGITPDAYFWNVAGVPLTTLQLTIVFLTTLVSFHIINKTSSIAKVSPIIIDVCIAVSIYMVGVWVWSQTPMLKHFNALRPAPPVFQYFPFSDTRIHDIGALSILEGYGIYFGQYTDKPLYMVFLSMLHRIAGNDYNKLSLLHLLTMGLILPGLFWFGRQFHSRKLGIAVALIILVRQRNAILLSHSLAGTNPRLLLTELPTMLGLIIVCLLVFSWIKKTAPDDQRWPLPLLAGGVLGAMSLIRLNPIGLLPFILTAGATAWRKTGVNWFRQVLTFMLGFLLVFTPWVITGRDANGHPYLWVKILDVINVRYNPGFPSIERNDLARKIAAPKVALLSDRSSVMAYDDQDLDDFPNFVINHALHNIVASFLTLPDSLSQNDQDVNNLIKRPYLDEKLRFIWHGEISAGQIPFLAINMLLLALGLGWSWGRWKWKGLFPAWIFIGYILTLGFARNSGSRYIVPIDWILYLYYTIGIFGLLKIFTNIFENGQEEPPPLVVNERFKTTLPYFAILTVVFLSVIVPIVQVPIVTNNIPDCENQVNDLAYQNLNLLEGKIFYPYLVNKKYSFVFLTCDQSIELTLNGFDIPLQNGQTLVIGFSKRDPNQPEKIFFEENSKLLQVWTR